MNSNQTNLLGITLQKEEMKNIQGGSAATFTCSCTGADGKIVVIEASSIEECWNAC